jgi:hypothetical protein
MTWSEALAFCADHTRGRTESDRVFDRDGLTHWIELGATGWPILRTESASPPFAQKAAPFTYTRLPAVPPGIDSIIAEIADVGELREDVEGAIAQVSALAQKE